MLPTKNANYLKKLLFKQDLIFRHQDAIFAGFLKIVEQIINISSHPCEITARYT
jgi:hypothetical protein